MLKHTMYTELVWVILVSSTAAGIIPFLSEPTELVATSDELFPLPEDS